MADKYTWVQQPDGSWVAVDPATGLPAMGAGGAPVAYFPSGQVTPPPNAIGLPSPGAGMAVGSAPVSPSTDYGAPAPASAPVSSGVDQATGLPLDPLGNGPTVAPGTQPATDYTVQGAGSSYGYSGGGYSRQSYGGSSGGYSNDPFANLPAYANGMQHPSQSGQPLVPGGAFNDQSGDDNRIQVTATSGATAGPYGVHAAPAPSSHSYGGGGGDSGGGGGGITRSIYNHFAGKLEGKLTGSSGGSYSDSSYRQPNTHPYRGPDDPRVARRIEQMDPRMRGQYGKLWNYDRGQTLYDSPQYMLDRMRTGLDTHSIGYGRMGDLPMTQLALLTASGERKNQAGLDTLSGKANPMGSVYDDYYKKLNKRLSAGKPGIDFMPFYRKAMRHNTATSDYANTLGELYNQLGQGQTLDVNTLRNNLFNPAKGTYYQQAFRPTKAGTEQADIADTFLSAYNATLNTGRYGDTQKAILAKQAQDAVSQYMATYGGRKPKKAPTLNSYVGQRLGS